MNRFQHHHRDAIDFGYSCFDRLLLNGRILQFGHRSRGGSIRWFLQTHRDLAPSRAAFARIASDYHHWVDEYALQAGLQVVEPPKGARREDLVEPYFQQLGSRHGIAVILKAREPEDVAWHFAKANRVSVERHVVNLYYFYLRDPHLGRLFVRICPYFPFNVGVWLNGHEWLAAQLQREGIGFDKRDNLFVACARPERLQELSDAFAPADILGPVEGWLARLLPYFSDDERQRGFRHQFFLAQVEYCHNLIFRKEAALGRLFDRLMDANRGMGHPDKLAVIFGRPAFRPHTREGRSYLKMTKLRTAVLSSGYQKTSLKQYIKEGVGLRTESATYQLNDLSLRKNLQQLPQVRTALDTANQRYQDVQQDVLATFVDRGQLQPLRQASVAPSGRRVPGLHLDDPRLLAVLQAIVCFAYLVGRGGFRTRDLLVDVQKALGNADYRLSQLRYDLSKLRSKGLLWRRPGTQTYELGADGYRIAIYYLKLYQQMYAPLAAAIRDPVPADNEVLSHRQTKLDRLYVAVTKALVNLADHLGMAA